MPDAVVQSAMLRSDLVRLRKDSGLTQEQVAADLEWSPSKLIRIEGGRSSVTKVDLDALLSRYGVTSESTRERLQDLNRGAREAAWWDSYKDEIADSYLRYVGFEAGASFIRQYENVFVPGTLQTPQYAQAVTVGAAPPRRIAAVVGLRLRRQAELAKRSIQPRRYYVVDEAVIRRHVGVTIDPAIMPTQLRSIADRAETDDRVTVRVIPFSAGAHPGLLGPFTLLEFEGELQDILYIDAGRGEFASMAQGGETITDYRDDFESLLEDALSADKSIELIRSAAEEMS